MAERIAILGIYHESNTFVEKATTRADFEKGHFLRGEEIRQEYHSAHHEIGGMIEVLDQAGMEVIPVFFAEATPGGTITADTFHGLISEMLERLEQVLPIDGCMVVPHGAGVSEAFRDMDGYWIGKVREILGDKIPIISSLDLHANVSQTMVSATDAMVSYKKNPHIDMRQTGQEAARLMVGTLRNDFVPKQVLIQTPVAISIEQQFTSQEPCLSLYQFAATLADRKGILSLSILLGFPYADVEEMGTSIIVVADNDEELARSTGKELEDYIVRNREQYVGVKYSVEQALSMAEDREKPVLLLDMGDNIGGGSPANNISILEGLLSRKSLKYFLCLCDPWAVEQAGRLSVGEAASITFTGTVAEGRKEVTLLLNLRYLSDGNFQEDSPRHGGQVNYYMGDTVVMETEGGSTIMFTTLRVPPFSLHQLYSCHINPDDYDVIIAKGVIAPLAAYAPVTKSSIQVNTPGVTQADMTMFSHRFRRRPLFPFEQ